jgi:hypothetical protein
VGSVLAFFRGAKWAHYFSEVGVGWSNPLAGMTGWGAASSAPAAGKEVTPTAPVPAFASPVAVTGKKRGAQQKAEPKTSPAPVSPAGDKKSPALAAAAAATRRSTNRRTVSTRTQQWLGQWWEARWAEVNALAGTNTAAAAGPVLQRPLVIALLYSVLMILVINLFLKAGPDLSGKYAQFLGHPALLSAPYLERWDAVNAWLRASSKEVLQRGAAWTTLRSLRQQQDSGAATGAEAEDGDSSTAGTSFDFTVYSASQFSLFGADIENSAATHAKKLAQNAPSFLIPPTHWVREGDSVTFGDFGSYGASAPKSPAPTSTASTSGASASTSSDASAGAATASRTAPASTTARTTASTTSSSTPKVRTVPSESVQKTQYVPKSEYVLSASSVLGSLYTYQWTKDGANITGDFYQNQPYFSIKKTAAGDAGVYRCFRYDVAMPNAPPVLVMETAIQISSKLFFNIISHLLPSMHEDFIVLPPPVLTRLHRFSYCRFPCCISTEPPTVALKPSYHEIKVGTTMVLNLAAEGTPPPVFQWFKNGYPVPGLTAQVLLMEGVNATHSGTYSCDVQNIAGRVLWLEATILVVD